MIYHLHALIPEVGVRRGIDRKKVGCRSLIDANLEGQVGVIKFEQYSRENFPMFMAWWNSILNNALLRIMCLLINV